MALRASKSSHRLSSDEDTLLGDAAKIVLLNKTDFVRLAINRMLVQLYDIAADRAALLAQQFFLERADKRWQRPYGDIDFASRQVRTWLNTIRTIDPCPTTSETRKAQFELNGIDGLFDSAFARLHPETIPAIAEARKRDSLAYRKSPEPVTIETMKLIMLATSPGQDRDAQVERITMAEAAVQELVRQNYRALIDGYLALPNLVLRAKELGAPAKFIQTHRQDPWTLFETVEYLRMQRVRDKQVHPDIANASLAEASLAELRAHAKKSGADELFLRQNKNDKQSLTEFIKEKNFDEGLMRLNVVSFSADYFREYIDPEYLHERFPN